MEKVAYMPLKRSYRGFIAHYDKKCYFPDCQFIAQVHEVRLQPYMNVIVVRDPDGISELELHIAISTEKFPLNDEDVQKFTNQFVLLSFESSDVFPLRIHEFYSTIESVPVGSTRGIVRMYTEQRRIIIFYIKPLETPNLSITNFVYTQFIKSRFYRRLFNRINLHNKKVENPVLSGVEN